MLQGEEICRNFILQSNSLIKFSENEHQKKKRKINSNT